MKNTLGDMGSGHAFDSGCTCFDSCSGVVNHLRGKKTECTCNVSGIKTAAIVEGSVVDIHR